MAPRLLAWVIKRMPLIRQELLEEKQTKAENHEQCLGHGELHAVRDFTRNKESSGSGWEEWRGSQIWGKPLREWPEASLVYHSRFSLLEMNGGERRGVRRENNDLRWKPGVWKTVHSGSLIYSNSDQNRARWPAQVLLAHVWGCRSTGRINNN